MKKYDFPEERRAIIEKMRQPFAFCQLIDGTVVFLAVTDGFLDLFEYTDRELLYANINNNMFQDVHPEDTARVTNAILRFGAEDEALNTVYRSKKRFAAGYRLVRMTGEHMTADDGSILTLLWFTDEGDYREDGGEDLNRALGEAFRAQSVTDVTRYDYLTGLPNLSYFFELAEVGRKFILNQGGIPVLLYIDLKGMKRYNHQYGFTAGDKMLKQFARTLSGVFHASRCCHIGADRFAAVSEEDGLTDKLDALISAWRQSGAEEHLRISVGIYPHRFEPVPVGMAYDRAKIACDCIKSTYGSAYRYFDETMNEGVQKRQFVLENFEAALADKRIQVFYQPIVRAVNGMVCDEEALARWIDPDKGFLSPADFIPTLEEAGLIYKLDLYVLDEVLSHMRQKADKGYFIVPHSINLSRSDFDACDMVEEIRRRVDAAGISRDRISIEITESIIGSDFDFMKNQITRFQNLGFPVWMDDFGSGYSSLDVLHSIKFDLLKFDMGFMRRLDENDSGKIMLTELMKMALALGIDTICEGVETESQVRFLQEIGCSKLQGFYFSKPMPFADTLAYHDKHKTAGYENPEESGYYELVCGVNLYDVAVIARDEQDSLQNTYSTLPMCIIEVKDDRTRFVRTNRSYRDFFMRFFDMDLTDFGPEFVPYDAAFMKNVVKTCCEQGVRTFYDEKMPDGSVVHSFARRIGVNDVTGTIAVAIAVLSIREPNEKLMIEQILSVIESFGETMPGGFFIYRADDKEELLYANQAVFDIFGCADLAEFKALTGFTFRGMVHPDDYERISDSITDQVSRSREDLDFVEYRIIRKDGEVRWIDDYGHYVEYDEQNSLYYVFISDITDKYERARSDKARHDAVIEALTKSYDSVWLITDMEKESFELFRIDPQLKHMIPADAAVKLDTFTKALRFYTQLVVEEDRARLIEAVTPEKITANTENNMIYSVPFRRIFEDGIRYYRLEFTKMALPDGQNCVVGGFKNVDEIVRKEQQAEQSLKQRAAVIEALGQAYDAVWLIHDMDSERFELYHVDKDAAHALPTYEAAKIPKFSDALRFYSKLILKEDRQRFLSAVTPERIRAHTADGKIYSVPFRRVFDDGIGHYRVEFFRSEANDGDINIIGGFKNVDEPA